MSADFFHSDSLLLEQLSQGDQRAFETLYNRYWSVLLNAAFKRLDNRQQSEDLVQNVFLRLWNKRAELQIDNLPAYLHTAVRYETLKFVTQNKIAPAFYDHLETVLMETESADSRIMTAEIMELVKAYADALPNKRRRIFLLHIQNRLSTKQIADMLTISQKTVQNQLITALNGLKTRIIPAVLAMLAACFFS